MWNFERFYFRELVIALLVLIGSASIIHAQSTAFTYQGRFTDNGNPADGMFDIRFKLFDTANVGTGTQQGPNVTHPTVQVTKGVFTVQLDFGACASCFDGAARYLEIAIRPAGSPDPYTVLSPRQPVAAAPYSIMSLNATQLGGMAPSGFIQNSTSQQSATNFNISGSGTAAGTLSANAVNATAQYNLGGSRVLAATSDNLFVGISAGAANTSGVKNSFFGAAAGQNNTTGFQNSYFGALAGLSNTSGTDNSFFGVAAGQSNTATFNSFFGSLAGLNNTSGAENAFFGASAGKANTTGFQNSFFGSGTGFSNQTGSSNAFFGYHAGLFSISSANSFFGAIAGQANTTGSFNSFFGASAGSSNTAGFNNNFFGSSAGGSNTSGNRNSFFGSSAGGGNTTGIDNTFVGYGAGDSNTVENFNTFVGSQANGAAGISNSTAIGANATVTQSNSLVLGNGVNVGVNTSAPKTRLDVVALASQIRFGNTANDNGGFLTSVDGTQADLSGGAKWNGSAWFATAPQAALMELAFGNFTFYTAVGLTSGNPFIFAQRMVIASNGHVGIGTPSPNDALEVWGDIRVGTAGNPNGCVKSSNGSVIVGSCSSDVRFKKSITPFRATLDRLVRLQPVYFYWRTEEYPEKHFGKELSYGLVAQDVEKVMPDLVGEDKNGFKLVHYHKLPILMLQAIKEIKAEKDAEIAALKSEQAGLKKQNAALEARLRALERKMK